MSGQLRFLTGYEQLVKNLLKSLPEDDAAAQAVGGSYESRSRLFSFASPPRPEGSRCRAAIAFSHAPGRRPPGRNAGASPFSC
jgi:hypothetical protein